MRTQRRRWISGLPRHGDLAVWGRFGACCRDSDVKHNNWHSISILKYDTNVKNCGKLMSLRSFPNGRKSAYPRQRGFGYTADDQP